jgi:signal transduction histidine kinase
VVALTAPTDDQLVPEILPVDDLAALRVAAQPWSVIAAGIAALAMFMEHSGELGPAVPGWLVLPASIAVGAPLILMCQRPVMSAALAWVAATAYSRLIAPLDGSLSGAAFAMTITFGVAALSRRREAAVGLLLCWLGLLLGVRTADPVGDGLLLLVCWLGGLAVNEVNRLVEQTRANNELLAREETSAQERAVVDERLRLSREIHDAIGHSLTVVALQAGAARRFATDDPGRAREVMRTVAAAARSGVASLALDATRADIAGLVERVRATGLMVDADLADEAVLDPVQRLTAFRIVQEGLTNVLKHAPGSRATVTVRRGDEGIEIVVANSAPVGTGSGPGSARGLAGIRERVDASAGQVVWGAEESGGFEIRALLPALPAAVASP